MLARLCLLMAVVLAALLLAGGPAAASLGGDAAAGGQLSERVQAGRVRCDRLSGADFDRLGEYAMDRMTGSRVVHAALDRRMAAMMGSASAERMHELVGRRFARCATASLGPRSPDWSWMRAGAWRHMSGADWQRLRSSWMGPAMMGAGRDGWSGAAVTAVAIAALLAGALLVLVARRPRQQMHT